MYYKAQYRYGGEFCYTTTNSSSYSWVKINDTKKGDVRMFDVASVYPITVRPVRFLEYCKGKLRYGRGKAYSVINEGGSRTAYLVVSNEGKARWIPVDEVRFGEQSFSRDAMREIKRGYVLQELFLAGKLNLEEGVRL